MALTTINPSQFFHKINKNDVLDRPTTDGSGVLIQLAASNNAGVESNITDTIYMIAKKDVRQPYMQNGMQRSRVVTKYFKILNRKVLRYFEQTYNKYANFAISHFFTPVASNGTSEFTTDISRFGDMIFNTYLSLTVPAYDIRSEILYQGNESARWAWCTRLGNAVIRQVEMTIGNQKVDENDTNILNFSRELSLSDGRQAMYNKLIGNTPELCEMASAHPQKQLYVPLNLFFNKSTACVLPAVQIQYFKLELYFQLRTPKDLVCHNNSLRDLDWDKKLQFKSFHLVTRQIFLTDEERFILTRNAVDNKEILFEKYQKNTISSQSTNVVTINHSVKELVWIAQMKKFVSGRNFLYYAPILDKVVDTKRLTYNATIRFVLKTAMYAKSYKFVPHQKGLNRAYASPADVAVDEPSFNKVIVQSKGPTMNQLEFAVLASQAASFCPKTIVHFMTQSRLLTQVRELSQMEGIRVLDSNYVEVTQTAPIAAFEQKFICLDHAYGRIKPTQSSCTYFNQSSVTICGDTLRIEEISIPVDIFLVYAYEREVNVRVSDKIQGFFYQDQQASITADDLKEEPRIIPQYLYTNDEIELFVFLSIQGLQQINFACSSTIIFVDTITLSSNSNTFYFIKNSQQPQIDILEPFNDRGQYVDSTGATKYDPYAFSFGSDPLQPNFNIGIGDFDVRVTQWDNYGMNIDKSGNPYLQSELKCNGICRFTGVGEQYFNYLQPFECHNNTPADGINIYPFAIKPEDTRPNGSMNFSRIEQIHFNPTFNPRIIDNDEGPFEPHMYALSYNILSVMAGAAVVKFAA